MDNLSILRVIFMQIFYIGYIRKVNARP